MNSPTSRLDLSLKCHITSEGLEYCKFGNFRENFIFANSVKRHICELKKPQVEHDLPISVKDIEITPFREGFIVTKLRMRKFPNLQ